MTPASNLPRKERFAQIIALVNEAGAVEVERLADLRYLEAHGRLLRTYGGARSVQASDVGSSFDKRREEHVKAKEIMAFKAARLIAPGLTIALDGSTSCYFLAKALPPVEIVVVTNSMRILNLLKSKPRCTLIGTGGQLDEKHEDFALGEGKKLTQLDSLRIDLCFISCVGVDLNAGIFDMNEGIARMKAELMRRSVHTVLLADASKYIRRTPFRISTMREITFALDDGGLKESIRKRLHELDINII